MKLKSSMGNLSKILHLFSLIFLFLGIIFFVRQTVPSKFVVRFSNGKNILVDVARTQKAQEKGLSGRASLAGNEGMLFIHGTLDYESYWMKEMFFPIDLIWISDNQVVGVLEDLEPQKSPFTVYTSPVPVDKVLEVNAGIVQKNSIKIGDFLDIPVMNE